METKQRRYRQSDELVAKIQELADLAGSNRTTVVEVAVEALWKSAQHGTRSREPYEVRADLAWWARGVDERRLEAVIQAQQEGQKRAREEGTWPHWRTMSGEDVRVQQDLTILDTNPYET